MKAIVATTSRKRYAMLLEKHLAKSLEVIENKVYYYILRETVNVL